jgi:hypothetical protein
MPCRAGRGSTTLRAVLHRSAPISLRSVPALVRSGPCRPRSRTTAAPTLRHLDLALCCADLCRRSPRPCRAMPTRTLPCTVSLPSEPAPHHTPPGAHRLLCLSKLILTNSTSPRRACSLLPASATNATLRNGSPQINKLLESHAKGGRRCRKSSGKGAKAVRFNPRVLAECRSLPAAG